MKLNEGELRTQCARLVYPEFRFTSQEVGGVCVLLVAPKFGLPHSQILPCDAGPASHKLKSPAGGPFSKSMLVLLRLRSCFPSGLRLSCPFPWNARKKIKNPNVNPLSRKEKLPIWENCKNEVLQYQMALAISYRQTFCNMVACKGLNHFCNNKCASSNEYKIFWQGGFYCRHVGLTDG